MFLSKKDLIKLLLKDTKIKIDEDIQNTLKGLFEGILQQTLEAEIDEHLGYSKYDYENKIKILVVMKKVKRL